MTGGVGKDLSVFDSLGDSSTTNGGDFGTASTRGSMGDSFASSRNKRQTAQFDLSDIYQSSESKKEFSGSAMSYGGGSMGTAAPFGGATSADPFEALQNPSSTIPQSSSAMSASGSGTNFMSQASANDAFSAVSSGAAATGAVPPAPESRPKGVYARVKFTKAASSGTELSITAGDTLAVLSQDGEWWYGTNIATGKNGFFPWNYVEVRDDLDPTAKVKAPEITSRPPPAAPIGAKQQAAQIFEAVTPTQTASASELTKQSRTNAPVVRRQIQRTVPKVAQLSGDNFAFQPLPDSDEKAAPTWYQPWFLDFFAAGYKRKIIDVDSDPYIKKPAATRARQSITSMRTILERAKLEGVYFDDPAMAEVNSHILQVFSEACELTEQLPAHTNDPVRFFSFLTFLMMRIKAMREGGIVMVPTSFICEDNTEHGLLVLITKTRDSTDANYSVCIINTVEEKGLKYHASSVDPSDGAPMRNLAFEMNNIPNDKILNTSFWFLLFRGAVKPDKRLNEAYIYDKCLPFLTSMPILSALQIGMALQIGINDFRRIPGGGDSSIMCATIEAVRYIARSSGMTPAQADHFPGVLYHIGLNFIRNDLQVVQKLTPIEVDIIRIASRSAATSIAGQIGPDTTAIPESCAAALETIKEIEKRLDDLDDRSYPPPAFDLKTDQKQERLGDWEWFGRLRCDADIEALAGEAPVPPIMRPIELTLVPERVSNFNDVSQAFHHTVNLCVLLSNQKRITRNSYTIRLNLISHLFMRVIPIPLPINHADRNKLCFWHAQPIRSEMQSMILRQLNLIARHFAAASLSVKATRSGDATRMLTFAVISAVCDACLRKVAVDVPSALSLQYSGEAVGPVRPFGFTMGNFAEESEFLKFSLPEAAAARAQVLDYFHNMRRTVKDDHLIFRFDETMEVTYGDKLLVDQICIHMGFQRNCEKEYLVGLNRNMLDHYPELAYFRDIIFMFKLTMVPTCDKLPDLRPWNPEQCALGWNVDTVEVVSPEGAPQKLSMYQVGGFNKKLDAIQTNEKSIKEQHEEATIKRKGLFNKIKRLFGAAKAQSRATPSQANPSILLNERVETEDDVLHIRKLPDFDGTLGSRDCELLCQYLTAPYMRIPLLLKFFSEESRLKALRAKSIQEVIDAALFEPGAWQEEVFKGCGSGTGPG